MLPPLILEGGICSGMAWGPGGPAGTASSPTSASLSPQLHGEGYLLQKVVSINKVACSMT